MFSVYGASGRLFRGTLEQLRQVAPVHSVDRPRALEPVWRDERDALPFAPPPQHHPEAEHTRYREALAAYATPKPPAGQRWSRKPVGDVMSRDVLTLADTDPVARAWRLLDKRQLSQAPVVNATGVLVGMVTLSRLARLYTSSQFEEHALARSTIAEQPLAGCMLTPVPSVAAEADLRRAAGLLLESALPGLPVVDDDGRVTGFVSRSDILRAVLDDTAIDQWG
jgi:CBS domain-containing protein